ncbi:type 1 fimbrial protein [Providencia stuartii]|uniref:Fimbrial protein n=2 Tax=Providencia stuartii TaxID=588 RepID=A0AA86YXE3_PROST|nr:MULTISPECIES: fimbrial protein [Providencia]SST03691.1 PAP fimbrial minor pilin protein precursor [Acinetobacter baumannii]AFH94307.1 fimbrial subunit [Providencia stuartii MRSN 2154]AMG67363.1 type 1 fimbrial protein [Providencia stuartii]APG52226.1 fimbrial protein [Providencia stuartii]AVL41533.1 type 1 fimbrial protein [Providencia stuartii]
MAVYQRVSLQTTGILFSLILGGTSAFGANEVGMRHEGVTQLVGSVISTPCSIVMSNRDQTVDFSSLTLTMLSTAVAREQQTRPFDIELRDCGSVYSTLDSKTWTIRFDGQGADNIDAFALQGPSQGLGVSVLDNTKNIVIPGETYPLFDSVLRQGQSGQTLFLRYFLRLELTGKPLQAGRYHGLVRFFIDYQ